jgi:HEAT repeat protein
LIEALTRASGHEARQPIRAQISRLGRKASAGLVRALGHPNAFTRWEAVSLLGETADPAARERVIAFALGEDEVHARWRAFWAVSRYDSDRVRNRLLRVLHGRDKTRQWRAALMLSMLGAAEAGPVLLRGLQAHDEWIQWEALGAVKALRLPGAERAVAKLAAPTRSLAIRQEATLALGAIGSAAAVKSVISLLADKEPEVRWRAALALCDDRSAASAASAAALRRRLRAETDKAVRQQIQQSLKLRETGA